MSRFTTKIYKTRTAGEVVYYKGETINPAYETFDDFGTYWSILDENKEWRGLTYEPTYTWLMDNITNNDEELFLMML
jgi:hypothetical protein